MVGDNQANDDYRQFDRIGNGQRLGIDPIPHRQTIRVLAVAEARASVAPPQVRTKVQAK